MRAVDGRYAGRRTGRRPAQQSSPRAASLKMPRVALGGLALMAILAAAAMAWVPVVVLVAYAGFSAVSYLAYWRDKAAARAGRWRVEEGTLHLLDVFGGWPGALIAQQQFRHKTAKVSFQAMFWMTVLLNVGAMAFAMHRGWA